MNRRRAQPADPPEGAEPLARLASSPETIALFLDVDGTLLRIAATPAAVVVERRTVDLIGRAHRATGGAIAFISGRAVADLDRLFAPLRLPAAGQHGLERRDAHGTLRRYAEAPTQLTDCRAQLEAFARAHPGVLIEDKRLTVCAHYRLAPHAEPDLAALVAALAAESHGALTIQRGKMVLELRPAGRDKGTAIAEFMAEAPFRGRTPVFLGDDQTDEFGFSLVNEVGGASVKVGAGPTQARLRLRRIDDVLGWLERLATER